MTTKPTLSTWGERLTAAAAKQGLNQRRIATATGHTTAAVSRWFRGERRPSEELQVQLADIVGLPVTALFPRCAAEEAAADARV